MSNKDCVDIDSGVDEAGVDVDGVWFGGAEEYNQYFPLRKSNSRAEVPYVTGDMLQDRVRPKPISAEIFCLTSNQWPGSVS